MPGEEEIARKGGRSELAALLFMVGGMYTLDAYSTLNSSPWTAENFGANPEKAKSCREYVWHAVAYSTVFNTASSVIGGTPWPLAGAVANNLYLFWLYDRALKRAISSGSQGWKG